MLQKLLGKLFSAGAEGPDREPVEITGVCDLLGPSIDSFRTGAKQVGRVTLIAWRTDGREIETGQLVLKFLLPFDGTRNDAFLRQFAAQNLVRVTLTSPPRPLASWLSATVANTHSVQPDPALESKAAELLDPPPLQHPVLGTFTHHPRLVWQYHGNAKWGGADVDIVLQGHGPFADIEDLNAQADAAAAILEREAQFSTSLERVLLTDAYSEWSNEWRNPSHGEVSAKEYARRLRLCAIYPSTEGYFEFELDAGDLHDGHFVMAYGTMAAGFEGAGVPG